MYIGFLYLITIFFLGLVVIKANRHKEEWLLLLLILSYVKTCITYLFAATTVFTVFTVGETQVHLDDIVLIIVLLFCAVSIFHPFRGGKFLAGTLLLLIPISISLLRGAVSGTLGSAVFLSDTRKFVLFLSVLYAVYFLMRKPKAINRIWKLKWYIDGLMNIVLIYILIIWILDLGLGIHDLPGQIGGTQSDGGSTFRIINPSQVLMIAFYTLYKMYEDLNEKKQFTVRTILFTIVVILLQWRTVVASFMAGGVILLIIAIRKYGVSQKLLRQIIFLCISAAVMLFLGDQTKGLLGMVSNLFESFSSIVQGTGTFSTRTYVWGMILSSLYGINTIFGLPFGQSLGIEWTASAHNGYIDYIAKMGYLGVACLVCFIIFLLIRAIKNKDYICAVILFVQAVYWYGYGFSLEQGAILGFILAVQELKKHGYMDGGLYAE